MIIPRYLSTLLFLFFSIYGFSTNAIKLNKIHWNLIPMYDTNQVVDIEGND